MKIDINRPVVYVEPNMIASSELADDGYINTDTPKLMFPLEDYGIYVDLKVEIYGRGLGSSSNANRKTFVVEWNVKENSSTVSFMAGSKYGPKGERCLTTRYTNSYLYDWEETKESNELFGISSIDVKYNQYIVPEVTIEFVDIRGVDLFGKGQRAHTAMKDGIGGFRDGDIADSFFNCFFMTPYPKFSILFKGFYGQPVAYDLVCKGFKTSFDSNNGNFKATATFVGYAYAFLSDVSFNALMAAPYSDAGGKDYWQRRVEQLDQDFFLYDINGNRAPIPTFGELLVALDGIEDKVKAASENSEAVQEKNAVEDKKEAIDDIKNMVEAFMLEWQSAFSHIESKHILIGGGTHDLICLFQDNKKGELKDEDVETIKGLTNKFIETCKKAGIESGMDENYDPRKAWFGEILDYNKSSKAYTVNDSAKKRVEEEAKHPSPDNVIKELVNAVNGNSNIKDGHYCKGYIIYNPMMGVSKYVDSVAGDVDAEMDKATEEADKAVTEIMSDILGFVPSVYNFTKIAMAHLEVYAWLYYNTATKIYQNKENRTLENLGLSDPSYQIDFSVSSEGENFVPPFPLVSSTQTVSDNAITEEETMDGTQETTRTVSDNGDGTSTIIEEDWLGNISKNFEEINFVHGLLNGAKNIGDLMYQHTTGEIAPESGSTAMNGDTSTLMENDTTERKNAVTYPLSASDAVGSAGEDKGPWSNLDMNSYSDFCGKVFLRMVQVIGYPGNTNNWDKLGAVDGKNFAAKYGSLYGIVGDKVFGEHPFDEFSEIILGNDKKYIKNGKFSWEGSSQANYGIAKKNGGSYSLNTYTTPNGCVIVPMDAMSFGEINKDLLTSSANPPTSRVPANISKYGFTDDSGIQSSNTARSDYVFKVDHNGFANYMKKTSSSNDLSDTGEKQVALSTFNGSLATFCEYVENWFNTKEGDGWTVKYVKDVLARTPSTLSEAATDNAVLDHFPTVVGKRLDGSPQGVVFASKLYNQQVDVKNKAYLFLCAVSAFSGLKKNDLIKKAVKTMVDDNVHFKVMPYHVTLLVGAEYFMLANNGNGLNDIELYSELNSFRLRKEAVNALRMDFERWADEEFASIDATFNFGIKDFRIFSSSFKFAGFDSIKPFVTDYERLKRVYCLGEGDEFIQYYITDSFSLRLTESESVKRTLKDVILRPAVVITPSFNNTSGPKQGYTASINESQMKAYWGSFVSGVANAVKLATTPPAVDTDENSIEGIAEEDANSGTGGETTSSAVAVDSDAPEDVKVGIYHHCKTFYDKWIDGTDFADFDDKWKLASYFNPDDTGDGRFHFIDSYYNNVANRVLINPQIILEDIMFGQNQNGFSLLDFFSDVASKNRFTLFCLQNFKDLFNFDNLKDSFKPVPYLEMKIPDSNPDFVFMYSYEPSTQIDNAENEYPGDSFMLDNSDLLPLAIQQKDLEEDYPLPAFGVSYGAMYQSYFKDISVSMEKPIVTEQSLKTQYLLAGAANDRVSVREYVTYGQDLYSIYSNNAYTCQINMMGCAWIQPLMYFCLTNVPMFRGSYLISNVTHRITPGNVDTTFSGVRMANTATKLSENWVKKGYASEEYYERMRAYQGRSSSGGYDCGPSDNSGPYNSGGVQVPNSQGGYDKIGGESINGMAMLILAEGWTDKTKRNNYGTIGTDATATHQSFDPSGVITVGPGLTNRAFPKITEGKRFTAKEICEMFAEYSRRIGNSVNKYCPGVLKLGQVAIDVALHMGHFGVKHLQDYFGGVTTIQQMIDAIPKFPGKADSHLERKEACIELLQGNAKNRLAKAYVNPPDWINTIIELLGLQKDGNSGGVIRKGLDSYDKMENEAHQQLQDCSPNADGSSSGEGGDVVNAPANINGTVRQKIVQLCQHYEGVSYGKRARYPKKHPELIDKWYRDAKTSIKAGGWCACFVYAILREAGATELANKVAKAGPAYPPNYKNFGKITSKPSPGDIVITKSNTSRHIGFVISVDGNNVVEIGGNQSGAVTRWRGQVDGVNVKFREDDRLYNCYRYSEY